MEPASASVIRSFLARSKPERGFYSGEFAEALAEDLGKFPVKTAADLKGRDALAAAAHADALFNALRIPVYFDGAPSIQIRLWERTLEILLKADKARYAALHKGTPFYFLGLASYLAEDFERALFYMDCALEQDYRLHGPRWYLIPSGMFVRLDDIPEAQAGRVLVRKAKNLFESFGERIATAGGAAMSIDAYRARLVNYGIERDPELRSVVTAFLSYLLEVTPRRTQLQLAPVGSGTVEPFFLHLFKGAVLFESLLRASSAGRPIVASDPRATLNTLLSSPGIFKRLMLNKAPQGLGGHTFGEVVKRVQADAAAGAPFNERAVRAVWAVRNTTGHSLASPSRPDCAEYEELFVLVLGSIMLAVNNLYQEQMLETGGA